MRKAKSLRFVDLFAGLGGFHLALTGLGHRCVFASEIDPCLADIYEKNFKLRPVGDIRKYYDKVPAHDILCAGFPCQPFSKAGDQLGFDCPQWGDLFEYVLAILSARKPRYFIIENVPNLMNHDSGKTWQSIKRRLAPRGYKIASHRLSPHQFGIPQVRDRTILVGSRADLKNLTWPEPTHSLNDIHIKSVLDDRPEEARSLPSRYKDYIGAWQSLLESLPKEIKLPSFPIWAMEFGATYPTDHTPASMKKSDLRKYRGAFGRKLFGIADRDLMSALPRYALDKTRKFPEWKIAFIQQNRMFYTANKPVIDAWLPTIQDFAPSFQKLEWNWQGGPRNLWGTVLQFRASGIRAKRPCAAPSLVALTTSQVPVIGWQSRYMTFRECARLQSMESLSVLPEQQTVAYKALGNAVNVTVIRKVAESLFRATRHQP